MVSLTQVHKKLIPILSRAEKMLLDAYYGETKVFDKDGIQNTTAVVTETDHKIDKFFRIKLKKIFPQIGFISEEIEHKRKKEFNWIIDPIDGTLNFSRKIPIFGISIALWKGNEPVYGLITLPLQELQLYAINDQGAFLNNKRFIYRSRDLGKNIYTLFSLVANNKDRFDIYQRITKIYGFPFSSGCATFNEAMAILGRADCAVLLKLSVWDIAAAVIIAREAKAAMKWLTEPPDILSGKYHGYKHSIIIGNPKIVERLSNELR